MTLGRVREIINQQLGFGGGYNPNPVRLLLGEVQRERGQAAVDAIIRDLGLEEAFGLNPARISPVSGAEPSTECRSRGYGVRIITKLLQSGIETPDAIAGIA